MLLAIILLTILIAFYFVFYCLILVGARADEQMAKYFLDKEKSNENNVQPH
jgi:hypothetical protein